jgi:hypothetical protein
MSLHFFRYLSESSVSITIIVAGNWRPDVLADLKGESVSFVERVMR